MQRRIGLIDLVAARNPIGPNVAELIEMIESPAGDKNQIVDRRQSHLQKSSKVGDAITDEGRTKRRKRPLLFSLHMAKEKSVCQCQPRCRPDIVLIIQLSPAE